MELQTPTKTCKMCFKDIRSCSIASFIHEDNFLCPTCISKFNLHLQKFKVSNVVGLSLFNYDEVIRKSLYQLKGCGDIEMAPVFLYRYSLELKAKFRDYYIIPMPSWKDDDLNRGFNHVIEIFRCLHLPILPILFKKENIKQALQKKWQRTEMIDNIGIISPSIIKNKKVLLVDDVMTTGSTLLGAIREVNKCNPKDIKILILAKNSIEERKEK